MSEADVSAFQIVHDQGRVRGGRRLYMGISPDTDPGPVRKMSWVRRRDPETGKKVADHTRLVYNEKVTVSNIPESAQGYVVNGKSPLDWMIDRYQVTTDGKTGITNDPNEYSDDPRYILDLIGRLVTVSMERCRVRPSR